VSEELANDVLLTVWTDAARFRGDAKVSTWVFGIAYRKALSHMRKRRLKFIALDENAAAADSDGARAEAVDWVHQGIESLPSKQRLTVLLVYFVGLSCDEAATATGVPASTVKTRMFHARRKLKLHLAGSRTPARWKEDRDDES
jgi:RNA polymerase sigma-70 factor (ECF subfamily)